MVEKTLIQDLTHLANQMDKIGMAKEAVEIDEVLREMIDDDRQWDVEQWEKFEAFMTEAAKEAIQQVEYEYNTFPFKEKVINLIENKAVDFGSDIVKRWINSRLNSLLMQSTK